MKYLNRAMLTALVAIAPAALAASNANYWDKAANITAATDKVHAAWKQGGMGAAIPLVQQCHAIAQGDDITPRSEQCFAMDAALYKLAVRDNARNNTPLPEYYEGQSMSVRVLPYTLGYSAASVVEYGNSVNRYVEKVLKARGETF